MRRATLRPGSAEAPDPAAPHARAAGGAAALARLAGALDCLERLLTGAFPAPVPLPGGAVLALAGRMLAMDTGPVAEGALPPPRPLPAPAAFPAPVPLSSAGMLALAGPPPPPPPHPRSRRRLGACACARLLALMHGDALMRQPAGCTKLLAGPALSVLTVW